MMDLKNLYKMHWSNKVLLRVIVIAALVGFTDTIYLTAEHYFGTGVECVLVKGCNVVLGSKYSNILGIPLSIFGGIFYAGVFVLVNAVDIYGGRRITKLLAWAVVVGFVISLALLYIQIFVLKSLCFYCLLSFISSTVIFVTSVVLYRRWLNNLNQI